MNYIFVTANPAHASSNSFPLEKCSIITKRLPFYLPQSHPVQTNCSSREIIPGRLWEFGIPRKAKSTRVPGTNRGEIYDSLGFSCFSCLTFSSAKQNQLNWDMPLSWKVLSLCWMDHTPHPKNVSDECALKIHLRSLKSTCLVAACYYSPPSIPKKTTTKKRLLSKHLMITFGLLKHVGLSSLQSPAWLK